MNVKNIINNNSQEELSKLGFIETKSILNSLSQISEALPDHIESIVNKSLTSPDPDICITNFSNLIDSTNNIDVVKETIDKEENLSAITTLFGASPFLTNFLRRYDCFFEEFFNNNYLSISKDTNIFYNELKELTKESSDQKEIEKTLRVYRNKEYVRIGLRDLKGTAHVKETTAELSDLASATLQTAYEFFYKELTDRYGEPYYEFITGKVEEKKKAEFTVIGMGKLGGRELNFSSDIDLIYIYSSDSGETVGIKENGNVIEKTKLDLRRFFVKLSEKITSAINNITEEGFVFRVDLELRPDGGSGAIASSIVSAENYYESFGASWERGAMIKARPVAGSGSFGDSLGVEFLKMIKPFVYRRYLDFGSIEEIKLMKEKIDLQLVKSKPGSINVKLGAGGIREIEFFCQALQLIHGGKNKDIQTASTLTAIEKLLNHNLIREEEALDLKNGYVFLRNLEHRIQIKEGTQTQIIPSKSKDLNALAIMMGIEKDGEDLPEMLHKKYSEVTGKVFDIYKTLFYSSEELTNLVDNDIALLLSNTLNKEEEIEKLTSLGFQDVETASEKIKLLSTDSKRADSKSTNSSFRFLPQKTRLLFEKLKPTLLTAIKDTADPDMALAHTVNFLIALSARASHYSMLIENPALVKVLISVFSSSSFLARTLIETPGGLDILLSNDVTRIKKTKEEILKDLEVTISSDDSTYDYEESLRKIRRQKNLETFRIGINNISGDLTNEEVGEQFTSLAEASLEASIKIAEKELEKRFGRPEDSSVISIIGMGKLGGREIIYGSDLDIIFVYSNKEEQGGRDGQTTGPKVISNHEYFIKLAQRIISVLSLKTSDGMAFEIDTELRPSGNAGTLVISSKALLDYYKSKAAGWEKQAFIRSRLVAGGSEEIEETIKEIKDFIYSTPPTTEELSEQLRIREKMVIELASESESKINIKTGTGGLVDIEFIVQTLQMIFGKSNPEVISTGTEEGLIALHKENLLTEGEWKTLINGYKLYRDIELKLRIIHDKSFEIIDKDSKETKSLIKKLDKINSIDDLFIKLRETAIKTRKIYLEKITPK